jgi:hypothetical protein
MVARRFLISSIFFFFWVYFTTLTKQTDDRPDELGDAPDETQLNEDTTISCISWRSVPLNEPPTIRQLREAWLRVGWPLAFQDDADIACPLWYSASVVSTDPIAKVDTM